MKILYRKAMKRSRSSLVTYTDTTSHKNTGRNRYYDTINVHLPIPDSTKHQTVKAFKKIDLLEGHGNHG